MTITRNFSILAPGVSSAGAVGITYLIVGGGTGGGQNTPTPGQGGIALNEDAAKNEYARANSGNSSGSSGVFTKVIF